MKLNIHIFIFLIVAVIAYINDIIIYCFKINYEIGLIISVITVITLVIFLIKYKKLKIKTDFQKSDFVLILIILFCIISLLKCDYSYDTTNYHIYIQENFFNDKINFDYFPGRTINSFLFPLGDRINYIFRYFLGYRLGTIMSLYSLIIIFYQMKTVLKIFFKDMSNIKVSLFSMIPIILYPVNEFVGTYYIDNYSCIILFQLVIIFCEKKDILIEKDYLYFSALLLGIGTAIKLPNLILGTVIFIFIVLFNCSIKNLRKVKIIDLLGLLFIFSSPFIIYAIDNYIQTGSPIYPYYNKVFKSEYFGDINWQDSAFGIPNIWCSLIWPIVIAIEPLYGNNYTCVGAIWGYGYIVCVFNTILGIKNRNFTWKLSGLGVALSIVWSIFLMGYARYAIVIPIVYLIVIFLTIFNLSIKDSIDIKNTLKICFAIILVIFIVYDLFIGIRLYVNKSKQYIREFPGVQKDVLKNEIHEKYEIDGVWGCINDNSAMISLIRNKNTPIYNLDSWHYEYSSKTKNMFLEKVKDEKIYTITDWYNMDSFSYAINKYGFELVSTQIKYENNIIQNKNNPWYIFEIRYVGE